MKEYKAKHIRPGMMTPYGGGEPRLVTRTARSAKHAHIYFQGENQELEYIVPLDRMLPASRKAKKFPMVSFSENDSTWDLMKKIEEKNLQIGDKFCLVMKGRGRKRIKKVSLVGRGDRSTCSCCGPRLYVSVKHKGKVVEFEFGFRKL